MGRSVRRAYHSPTPPTAMMAIPSMITSCQRSRVTDWFTRSCSLSPVTGPLAITRWMSLETAQ